MTIEVANALYRYFETLYYLNRHLIVLCGVDVLDNKGQYQNHIEEVIQAIPRLVPYKYDRSTSGHVLAYDDGLLEFSLEINFLKDDYEMLFQSNKALLEKVKRIRNKLEHKMHGARIIASSSGSSSLFGITYKIADEQIDIEAAEIIAFVKGINGLFTKIQNHAGQFARENNLTEYPYYWKLVRYNFSEFNKIYDSDLLRTFGKALLPF